MNALVFLEFEFYFKSNGLRIDSEGIAYDVEILAISFLVLPFGLFAYWSLFPALGLQLAHHGSLSNTYLILD